MKCGIGICGKHNRRKKQSNTFDPEEETLAYLKALVDTRVFFKKEIDTTSMTEILKAALVAEKDAIVFSWV